MGQLKESLPTRLANWFDDRTGYRKLLEVMLLEHIPGGAKWRYVWGSCLAFVFGIQLVTGLLLMTSYSAGDNTAWSSVYFIQYEMDFGWLIRGLHHFGSQTMVVLLGLHMLQVVIAGAHLPPREINWWLGMGLLAAVLGLSLTGYLLPWDQKGFWATQVATNIAGNLPVLGPFVQKVVVGGSAYGHHTLTRFYALHVAFLPPLVIVLIIAHLAVFRRHGVTAPAGAKGEGWFWPDQAFRDMLVCLVIFAVMLGLVVYGHGQKQDVPAAGGDPADQGLYDKVAHAGRAGLGANLDAPADPARPYPARPEWYFLFLFQLLKYFEGDKEIIGTVVIPNAVLVLLCLLPLFGIGRLRKVGHAVGVVVLVALLAGVGLLTYLAIEADRLPNLTEAQVEALGSQETEKYEKAKLFHDEQVRADISAHRAIELARDGIPAEGAVFLLRRDPATQGKKLFKDNCAVCHTHGNDYLDDKEFHPEKATASDLAGYGTKTWVREFLNDPAHPKFFGRIKDFKAQMPGVLQKARAKAKKTGTEKELESDLDLIAEWLGSHPRGDPASAPADSAFARGYQAFVKHDCDSCHSYRPQAGGTPKAPDFTGYGDKDWVRLMVMAPEHPLRYGEKNLMPAFRPLEGAGSEITKLEFAEKGSKARLLDLDAVDRELIIRFLTRDFRVVFGGEPISGPRQRD